MEEELLRRGMGHLADDEWLESFDPAMQTEEGRSS